MSLIVECPSCRAKIEAKRWTIEGSVSGLVRIYGGEVETQPDDQPTYWLYGATCPNCEEYFEFPAEIKLEWYENLERIYPRFQEEMEKIRTREVCHA